MLFAQRGRGSHRAQGQAIAVELQRQSVPRREPQLITQRFRDDHSAGPIERNRGIHKWYY
jgi:hypothetical protein